LISFLLESCCRKRKGEGERGLDEAGEKRQIHIFDSNIQIDKNMIIENYSLHFEARQFTVIKGPSGCGKR
jgi:ABC-type bacteriocin/lantibiotic exporter with double-glycine peptidase domain